MAVQIRQSNAELLRIIAMAMIVLHHLIVFQAYPGTLDLVHPQSWDAGVALFSHGFIYIGVNCFVLISGYFGIKASLRGFTNLYLTYAFYTCVVTAVAYFVLGSIGGEMDTFHKLTSLCRKTFMPFSRGSAWFMNCYLGLFMVSPLLNAAIERMGKREHMVVLLVLTILNLFLGAYCRIDFLNVVGSSVSQFVFLYMIGAYIKRFITEEVMHQNRKKYLGAYLLCGGMWAAMTAVLMYVQGGVANVIRIIHNHPFEYHNIFLIGGAIAFFLFMMSFTFSNKGVNWLAKSCLAVYLGHGILISNLCNYHGIFDAMPNWLHLPYLVVLTVAVVLICMLFDKVRIFVMKPIWWVYDKVEPVVLSWWNRLVDRLIMSR